MAIKAFFTVEQLGPGMVWLPDSLRYILCSPAKGSSFSPIITNWSFIIVIPGQREHADGRHTIRYASEAMDILKVSQADETRQSKAMST